MHACACALCKASDSLANLFELANFWWWCFKKIVFLCFRVCIARFECWIKSVPADHADLASHRQKAAWVHTYTRVHILTHTITAIPYFALDLGVSTPPFSLSLSEPLLLGPLHALPPRFLPPPPSILPFYSCCSSILFYQHPLRLHIQYTYRFVFASYRVDTWYWEVFDMLRRCLRI